MSALRQKTGAVSRTWDYSAALSTEKGLMAFSPWKKQEEEEG